jgi:hypothetical protein
MSAALLVLLLCCFSLLSARTARADDAAVLPRGRSLIGAENQFFFPTEQRWGPKGDPEDLAAAFNDRALDSSVFPLLSPLNAFVANGRASLGDTSVRFEYHYNVLDIIAAYGITDRLTVGVAVPYYWVKNDVRVAVNSGAGSSANVGLRTGPGAGPCALPSPVLPLACPNTRRITTEDVQQILGPGLPGIAGFGFKPVEDYSADGFGDIVVGAKYQYLKTDNWRLAATAGVRLPTGRQDDPDDLSDIYWSTGAYAIQARLHNDFLLSSLWNKRTAAPGGLDVLRTGDLLLDLTFRYDWVLPDHATMRIGAPGTLTTNRERVYRDLGDKFELEASGQYVVWSGLSVSALYKYGFKLEDRITSHRGFPTRFLEDDSDSTEHIYIARLNYSTLPLYMEGRFPIPVNVFVAYRDRFAGSGPSTAGSPSQVLKTRYIAVGLQIVF